MAEKSSSTNVTGSLGDISLALMYGITSLTLFLLSVSLMIFAMYRGLNFGIGRLTGWSRFWANAGLLLQFPIVHSFLLSRFGRGILRFLAPQSIARRLEPTTYVLIASLQLILVFSLWSPSQEILWEARGPIRVLHTLLFSLSWLLLAKSMWDGHLGVQLGYLGWLSVVRRLASVPWPGMRTQGLFRWCRQPIYFSFMLTLWTSPVWTVDKIVVALLWSIYCLIGPVLKERRQVVSHGEYFIAYQQNVPYWPGFRLGSKKGQE